MFFTYDPTYFWYIFIPTLLMSIGVQFWLRRTFTQWSRVGNSRKMTGEEVTAELFDETIMEPIPVNHVRGKLTDHYDPGKNAVFLSDVVYDERTVSAMAVAAHELGHVEQYQTGSKLITMRSFLLPAVQFSPLITYVCLLAGLIFNMTNMLWIGVLFFGLTVLFSVLTLPVEIDASKRAIRNLEATGIAVTEEDRNGARKVLRAAAMTYLAAMIGSVMQLFYYTMRVRQEAERQQAREAQKTSRQQQKAAPKKQTTTAKKQSSTAKKQSSTRKKQTSAKRRR